MKKYKELQEHVRSLADETRGPDRHVVIALSYQINALGKLDKTIKKLDKSTTTLMKHQIWLIVSQVFLALIAIILTVVTLLKS